MNCPRCERYIVPDFYCIGCGFMPTWPRRSEPMMDYCAFFDTEDEAIDHCRLVNRALTVGDQNPVCVIDGPDDNYAVVDLETAKEILDYPDSGLPCLVVTD